MPGRTSGTNPSHLRPSHANRPATRAPWRASRGQAMRRPLLRGPLSEPMSRSHSGEGRAARYNPGGGRRAVAGALGGPRVGGEAVVRCGPQHGPVTCSRRGSLRPQFGAGRGFLSFSVHTAVPTPLLCPTKQRHTSIQAGQASERSSSVTTTRSTAGSIDPSPRDRLTERATGTPWGTHVGAPSPPVGQTTTPPPA